ncbi:MAG: AraC family transcriptional regulator [Acidobacteriota bacterium]
MKIKVWHLPEFNDIELLKGVQVKHPHPKHWHEEFHLCLIEQGTGQMFYRGAFHETHAGSLFIVHPGELHSNAATHQHGCSFRTLNVSPDIVQRALLYVNDGRQRLPFFPTPIICDQDLLAGFQSTHTSFEATASRLERETLLFDLLIKLISRYGENRMVLVDTGKEPAAVKLVRAYIEENYAENISLETLAHLTNLSPFHLNRVFSKAIGLPPHAFQTQVRLLKARKFLAQGKTISEATYDAGFADQSHFTRHFKRIFGFTPSNFCLLKEA